MLPLSFLDVPASATIWSSSPCLDGVLRNPRCPLWSRHSQGATIIMICCRSTLQEASYLGMAADRAAATLRQSPPSKRAGSGIRGIPTRQRNRATALPREADNHPSCGNPDKLAAARRRNPLSLEAGSVPTCPLGEATHSSGVDGANNTSVRVGERAQAGKPQIGDYHSPGCPRGSARF